MMFLGTGALDMYAPSYALTTAADAPPGAVYTKPKKLVAGQVATLGIKTVIVNRSSKQSDQMGANVIT